jgi:hypothetical protein
MSKLLVNPELLVGEWLKREDPVVPNTPQAGYSDVLQGDRVSNAARNSSSVVFAHYNRGIEAVKLFPQTHMVHIYVKLETID